jgi:acylphosphatase
MRRVHLTASGLVQGVFFRASARDEARRLGVTGWIRNTAQETVEAQAQGETSAVEAFVEFCRQGPGQAWVEELVVDDVDVVADESGFGVQ